jgi:hypothetical protein
MPTPQATAKQVNDTLPEIKYAEDTARIHEPSLPLYARGVELI